MNTTEIIFYSGVIYTIVFFINRWLYFQLQKIDEDFYPNSFAVLSCFLFFLGTIVFTILILLFNKSSFFKFKKK
jgi:hypothetical protein